MRFLVVQPRRLISVDWNARPSLPEARRQRSLVIVRFALMDWRAWLERLAAQRQRAAKP